ncbi:pigment precursor permease [Serratia quinivorans]|nr:pigment precursor permease [Serratia quinivorans]
MRVEVMEHYGLAQPIDQAGYYETAHHKQLIKDIRGAIHEGRLIAVCGVVGSGKTVTLRRLQQRLREENKSEFLVLNSHISDREKMLLHNSLKNLK